MKRNSKANDAGTVVRNNNSNGQSFTAGASKKARFFSIRGGENCRYAVGTAVLSILVMCAIFWFSSGDGESSGSLSRDVTRIFAKLLFFGFGEQNADEQAYLINQLEPFIRKLAHFGEYALLGMTLYPVAHFLFRRLSARFIMSYLVLVLYAVSDEIHQLFINERAGKALDVLIDSAGGLFGIVIMLMLISLGFYAKNNGEESPNKGL